VDSNGRTIWIADAHRDDAKRFVVHADEANRFCRTRIGDSRFAANCLDKWRDFPKLTGTGKKLL
jgi:hypothetical protein